MKRRKLFEIVNEVIGENIYTSTKNLYWNELLSRYKLPEWFIEKYRSKFDINLLYNYQLLSIEYINKYFMFDRIHSTTIIKNQKLSEDFIEENIKDFSWEDISKNQILSWNFIKKHRKKVNWDWILLKQPFINIKEINKYIKDPVNLNIPKLLESNHLSQQYRTGKDWFVGYIIGDTDSNNKKKTLIQETELYKKILDKPLNLVKVKVYWEDLINISTIKNYEPIRSIKLI